MIRRLRRWLLGVELRALRLQDGDVVVVSGHLEAVNLVCRDLGRVPWRMYLKRPFKVAIVREVTSGPYGAARIRRAREGK